MLQLIFRLSKGTVRSVTIFRGSFDSESSPCRSKARLLGSGLLIVSTFCLEMVVWKVLTIPFLVRLLREPNAIRVSRKQTLPFESLVANKWSMVGWNFTDVTSVTSCTMSAARGKGFVECFIRESCWIIRPLSLKTFNGSVLESAELKTVGVYLPLRNTSSWNGWQVTSRIVSCITYPIQVYM